MLPNFRRKLTKATDLVRDGDWSVFAAKVKRNLRPATAPVTELGFLAHDFIAHKYWAAAGSKSPCPSEIMPMTLEQGKVRGRSPRRKNVIWIVLDALRFDIFDHFLRRGGLSRLINEAAYFPLTFSQGSWTYPSFFSFLTSRYPFNCGVSHLTGNNGTLKSACRDFDDSCPTIFETLRCHGYRATSILDGWDFTMRETAGQRHREARYFEQHWGWSALGRGKRFSSLTEIREATISAIESPEPITPFFLLIRSLYTHSPYRGIFDDPDYVIKLSRRGWVSRLVGGFQRGLERWENEFLNPVLRVLDDRGQIDNTIIMIMSDHGEMLWDLEEDLRDSSESDELWRHQLEPYNALIRVPLLIWGIGLRGTYPGVFRLVDVAPTLLDILGLEPDHDAYDGVSLFRPAERPIYADSAGYGYGGVALYTADGKYLISERLGNSLYKIDLTEYESLNRRERALDGDPVRAFVTRHGRFPDLIKEDENDSALVNRLRALGYVQ